MVIDAQTCRYLKPPPAVPSMNLSPQKKSAITGSASNTGLPAVSQGPPSSASHWLSPHMLVDQRPKQLKKHLLS